MRELTLPDGREVDGIAGLKQYLLTERQDDFARALRQQVAVIRVGRSLRLTDRETVDTLTDQFLRNDCNLRTLVRQLRPATVWIEVGRVWRGGFLGGQGSPVTRGSGLPQNSRSSDREGNEEDTLAASLLTSFRYYSQSTRNRRTVWTDEADRFFCNSVEDELSEVQLMSRKPWMLDRRTLLKGWRFAGHQ